MLLNFPRAVLHFQVTPSIFFFHANIQSHVEVLIHGMVTFYKTNNRTQRCGFGYISQAILCCNIGIRQRHL